MFELFLTKIRIPNFKIQLLGRAKRKGVGGKPAYQQAGNFCPPSLSDSNFFPPPDFVFRFAKCAANKFVMRRMRYIGNKSGMIESSNQINENEVADESI